MSNPVTTTEQQPVLFGYRNHAYHSDGGCQYFTTAEERDTALEELRTEAIDGGLSKSAARSGIVPFSVYSPKQAEDLDELCRTLNHLSAADVDFDPSSLPAFSDDAPSNTNGVCSWDESRMLVAGGIESWEIVPRPVDASRVELADDLAVVSDESEYRWEADRSISETTRGPGGAKALVEMADLSAEVRIALAAVDCARTHQSEFPGEPVEGDWDSEAWAIASRETAIGDAAGKRDGAWDLFRDTLHDAVGRLLGSAPAARHHVTRTVKTRDGLRDAYGHETCHCNEAGCSGAEQYLGSYDPTEVEHDGEDFTATTDKGFAIILADGV